MGLSGTSAEPFALLHAVLVHQTPSKGQGHPELKILPWYEIPMVPRMRQLYDLATFLLAVETRSEGLWSRADLWWEGISYVPGYFVPMAWSHSFCSLCEVLSSEATPKERRLEVFAEVRLKLGGS